MKARVLTRKTRDMPSGIQVLVLEHGQPNEPSYLRCETAIAVGMTAWDEAVIDRPRGGDEYMLVTSLRLVRWICEGVPLRVSSDTNVAEVLPVDLAYAGIGPYSWERR